MNSASQVTGTGVGGWGPIGADNRFQTVNAAPQNLTKVPNWGDDALGTTEQGVWYNLWLVYDLDADPKTVTLYSKKATEAFDATAVAGSAYTVDVGPRPGNDSTADDFSAVEYFGFGVSLLDTTPDGYSAEDSLGFHADNLYVASGEKLEAKPESVSFEWGVVDLILNEIRTDQPGFPDPEEFVEIRGEPGTSLDDVWFLYVGDHSGEGAFKGSGVIEFAFDLSGYTIPDDGHFLMAGPDFDEGAFGMGVDQVDYVNEVIGNAFENSDNVTAILVRGFTEGEILFWEDQLGDAAVDIDDNDDGVPNQTLPWTDVIDAIGLVESTASGEFYYGEVLGFTDIGPQGDFVPAHAWRAANTGEWLMGEYELFERDANGNAIGIHPEAFDTPGTSNFDRIMEHPQSVIVGEGGAATFTVIAGVDESTSYQWQSSTDGGTGFHDLMESSVFQGVTTAELVIDPANLFLDGSYFRVVVSGDGQEEISQSAVLTVEEMTAPSFGQQPERNFGGSGVSVGVAVDGFPEPDLQWQRSQDGGASWDDLVEGSPYSGVATTTLSLDPIVDAAGTDWLRVVASNTGGTVVSDVLVLGEPAIEYQPLAPYYEVGWTAYFHTVVRGIPSPTVQWEVSWNSGADFEDLVEGAPFSGTTENSLQVDPVSREMDGLRFRLVARNAVAEVVSSPVELEVRYAPVIEEQPEDFRVFAGDDGVLGAAVAANPAASLQWQFSFDGMNFFDLSDGADYSGVETETLSLLAVGDSLSGHSYRLRAENSYGVVTTQPAQLDVRQRQSYGDWAAELGLAAGEEDPGLRRGPLQLSNLEAFAFGVDPLTAGPEDLPHIAEAVGGESLTVRYQRHVDATGVWMGLQGSADLEQWSGLSPVEDRVVAYADGVETREAEVALSDGEPLFVRMQTVDPASMVEVPGGTLSTSNGLNGTAVDTFYIGQTEVTWGEWQAVRTWAASNGYDIGGVGEGCAVVHPVRSVSWYDVVKWCNAKSEMEGLEPVYTVSGSVYKTGEPEHTTIEQDETANGYRLPTEAEWEFAARGGNETNGYEYAGSDNLDEVGWYTDNSGGAACDLRDGRGTWPVGQKLANELGIYDMSGNVWEWCWDVAYSSYRRFRGGDWYSSALYCTVSGRSFNIPDDRDRNGGFRLARSSGN